MNFNMNGLGQVTEYKSFFAKLRMMPVVLSVGFEFTHFI